MALACSVRRVIEQMKLNGELKIEISIGEFFEGIIGKVRNAARASADNLAPQDTIRKLIEHDYASSLRRHISYRQVRSLLADFMNIFPGFNQRSGAMPSMAQLAEIARALGFHLKATPLEGQDGMAFRGFYVPSAPGMLKLPLVYVNTAFPPVAVATAFMHELAHHRSCGLFEIQLQSMHLLDFDYAEHLDDPVELAADIVVSVAGFPEPVARRIFTKPPGDDSEDGGRELSATVIEEIHRHLEQTYGLDLTADMPNESRVFFLSEMIHLSKLRSALLAEFDL